jgi:asparagine synthase (glutamine-hydrolysing)
MCGINGIFQKNIFFDAQPVVQKMNKSLAHRGPDADGVFKDNNIVLGHRRLSIIDVAEHSNQPFFSYHSKYVIVFNGEIYNYKEIKKLLVEYPFKTGSDTEVILAAYEKWGKDCVNHFNGMFAFAIWELEKQELFIARDRLGIKPLYYHKSENSFVFSSEIRAMLSTDLVPRKINVSALSDYIRYQTVHAPSTIIDGVQMLLPGYYIIASNKEFSIHQYWDAAKSYNKEIQKCSYTEIKKQVKELLTDSVKLRLIADVPFGAFLSGGIDSSAIVALMSQISSSPVKTFNISFDESNFSEAKYAKQIAEKFQTHHTEIKLSPSDFLNYLPSALSAMDHPSGDGPNTYVVSKVTKEAGITMALSGLGGDEVFAGYDVFNRSLWLNNKNWIASTPKFLKNLASSFYSNIKPSIAAEKLKELLDLDNFNLENTYPLFRKIYSENIIETLLQYNYLHQNAVSQIIDKYIQQEDKNNLQLPFLSKVSLAEINTYMQNVLLRDTDQMSMAHALEVRVPFLDYRMVEMVLGVPDNFKISNTPKKLLVDSMGDLLPSEIVNRPKMGFTFPWQNWMKKELKSFCSDRINALAARSFINKNEILKLWNRFLNNDPIITWSRIWYLVVLEDWLTTNKIE